MCLNYCNTLCTGYPNILVGSSIPDPSDFFSQTYADCTVSVKSQSEKYNLLCPKGKTIQHNASVLNTR